MRRKIKKEIVINKESLQSRVVILEEGKLEDFFIERSSEDRIVGSIFKGKIQNLEDGLQAAFIDLGLKKNAFIHYWDMIPEDTVRLEAEEGIESGKRGSSRQKRYSSEEIAKRFPIGSEIIVQVTKAAIGTKGPRVTANLSIPGRYLVMMPGSRLKGVSRKIEDAKERERLKKVLARLPLPGDNGIIVRTAGSGARKVSFVRDIRALTEIWNEMARIMRDVPAPCRLYQEPDLVERIVRDALTEDIDRIVVDSKDECQRIKQIIARFARRSRARVQTYDGDAPIFEHFDIERQLENAFSRKVWLKGGGYLILDETEALIAIDVNTGRHKGGNNQEESILQVNLEAADEVARQLRLRNIGGLVVIDFIDMKQKKNQNQVHRKLKEALQRDKSRTNVLPLSPLGLMEMTRQRHEESVRATTYMNCPYCDGRGKVLSAMSMSVEIQRRVGEVMRRHRSTAERPLPVKITVNPIVLERLRTEDEAILVELEEKYHGHMTFVASQHIHVEEFMITRTDTGEELFSNVERKTANNH
ncbi:MAG TPA: Rne/Rng family ribonuclease [Kiritimatiellia bacterium]|nr:Rne/Rng family ribonuclease [Kiritimatiellia bacterium]HMP34562.1 Rne/Rng family ribonuclease [Kiritimatiellia bacterium]